MTGDYQQQLIEWGHKYKAYARFASIPDRIEACLAPLMQEWERNRRVPEWVGVDLLRAWAFYCVRSHHFDDWQPLLVAYPQVGAIAEAIRNHPAARKSDMPPPRADWHGDVELLIPSKYDGEIAAAQTAHSDRIDNRDWTRYQIVVDGQCSAPMRKRQAVRTMIKALADKGIPFPSIADQLPAYGLRSVEGQITDETAVGAAMTKQHGVSEPKRWFIEDPLLAGEKTWVVYRMWALRDTEDALKSLQKAFPDSGVSFRAAN